METTTENGQATTVNPQITRYHVRERTWDEIHADLQKPVPQRLIKRLREKGQPDYIEWHTAKQLLDFYAPGWSKRITGVVQGEGMITVAVEITVPCSDGDITMASTGNEFTTYVSKKVYDANPEMYPTRFSGYGSPATNAEQQAFKRAAAQLGIAFDLYLDK